jgi:hypothetical protein
VRRASADAVAELGYRTLTAADGEAALAVMEREGGAVVLRRSGSLSARPARAPASPGASP